MTIAEEREYIQAKRRRGTMLKLVRQGHEAQLHRMDDFEMWCMLQELGQQMGRDQVVTMVQDLGVLGYLKFKQDANEYSGRTEISQIELSPVGLAFVIRHKSNDDILID